MDLFTVIINIIKEELSTITTYPHTHILIYVYKLNFKVQTLNLSPTHIETLLGQDNKPLSAGTGTRFTSLVK